MEDIREPPSSAPACVLLYSAATLSVRRFLSYKRCTYFVTACSLSQSGRSSSSTTSSYDICGGGCCTRYTIIVPSRQVDSSQRPTSKHRTHARMLLTHCERQCRHCGSFTGKYTRSNNNHVTTHRLRTQIALGRENGPRVLCPECQAAIAPLSTRILLKDTNQWSEHDMEYNEKE